MYYRVTRGYIEGANEITRSSAKRHPKFMGRVISVILLNRKPCTWRFGYLYRVSATPPSRPDELVYIIVLL